jgi:hypothetical protein
MDRRCPFDGDERIDAANEQAPVDSGTHAWTPTTVGPSARLAWLPSLMLSFASLTLAWAGIEVAVRWTFRDAQVDLQPVYWDQSVANRARWIKQRRMGGVPVTDSIDVHDSLLGWRNKSNMSVRWERPGAYSTRVTTDGAGLRWMPSPDRTSAAPTIRIGIYGDSLTFGEGVNDEEVYAAKVQALLPEVEVLNFGVHGYGTDQQLLYFQSEGKRHSLDIVVLGFAWFHISRNTTTFGFFAKPAFALRGDELELTNVPVPGPTAVLNGAHEDEASALSASWLVRWAWRRVQNVGERRMYDDTDSRPWQLTRRLLQDFVATASRFGSTVVIMSVDETRPWLEEPFGTFVREIGASYLNLGPPLREIGKATQYRIPNDGHWNEVGHADVARVLREHLCRTQLAANLCTRNDVRGASTGSGNVRGAGHR